MTQPTSPLHEDIVRKFTANINYAGPGGCWLWTKTLNPAGYGQFYFGRSRSAYRTSAAHRISYELFVGPIPEGLQLDHLCRVRHCVNPEHLEPVTNRVNGLRGISPAAINAVKTHCIHGHEFTPENTYVRFQGDYSQRMCRTCNIENGRRRRERLRAEAGRALAQDPRDEVGRFAKRDEHNRWTHCSAGHPLEGHNVMVAKGGLRRCRTCFNEWQARRRRAKGIPTRSEAVRGADGKFANSAVATGKKTTPDRLSPNRLPPEYRDDLTQDDRGWQP